ncbi:M16 family metallopeptidase [Methylobrevis pamukkalensis]|uniref:Protease 3 n=1 Tax=Methylobrevis pamukkalensis TaxID=1439726 RepID=A0A1E3H5Z3_9HYPH|nr:pitrilysin family protein [Methylobrevis pamukkalensis]ODN71730.1 Protease 3 precursor [Methylobrevis pamukkalensis]
MRRLSALAAALAICASTTAALAASPAPELAQANPAPAAPAPAAPASPVVAPEAANPAAPDEIQRFAPGATSFTLGNGLEVVVIPDHRAPVVTHMVWYKVGASDEPVGKTGIAHFLEHLMFKGTLLHPAGEFSRVIAENGGEENAFTSSDYTAYYQRVAREHLGLMMTFEADRMSGLVLTDSNVLPERQVILEERNMRLDGEPSAILSASVDAVLNLGHPYGVPVIGWREDMETLSRQDAIAFYDRFYTPNNAVLVVAGDVEPDEVRRLAEDTYGKVPRRAEPERPLRPAPGKLRTPRSVELTDAACVRRA